MVGPNVKGGYHSFIGSLGEGGMQIGEFGGTSGVAR